MRAIELLKRRLTAAGVEHEVRQLVRGREPASQVVDLAEEVGRRARRHRDPPPDLGKFPLGGTAQRVLLDAGCPVLAVKAVDGC
jgi:nucleotide-binding universal stress UspA family protein